MDILEKYLNEIDNSQYDHSENSEIDRNLQSIRDELIKEGMENIAKLAQLEMEIFNFTKKTEDKDLELSYKFASEGENEKGEKIRSEWPDSNKYLPEDFNYISKRFRETKNFFLKSEYGFVLLLSKNSKYKNDEIALEVLNSLLNLAEKYRQIIKGEIADKKHYSLYLSNILEQSFILSYNRRKNGENFKDVFKKIKDLIFNLIVTWNVKNKASRYMTDLVLLISNFYVEFKDYKLESVLDKLWELSNYLVDEYIHGSIDVAGIGLNFSKKINITKKYNWYLLIAQNYEKLAEEAKERNDLTYVSFIEDALRTYEIMKDENKITELRNKFIEAKTNYNFPSIATEIPNQIFQDSIDRAKLFLENASSSDVIGLFLTTPMISKLDSLREYTRKMYKETPLMAMISKSVIDKMGNTVAEYKYDNKEELFRYNLIFNYKLEFKFGLFEIDYIFTNAIRKKLFTAENVIDFIKNSWIGQDIDKVYNGKVKTINLLKVIKEQIVNIFEEIEKNIADQNYEINVIQSVDSLTLKFEYLFRFLAEKLGIATFTNKGRDGKNINEEKSLNSLLEDKNLVENFKRGEIEDDLFLFKFIFIEKVGWNLRNQIAHGLMDSDEYSYQQGIMLIVILLKLASYNFKIN